jgi:hypothetical protein
MINNNYKIYLNKNKIKDNYKKNNSKKKTNNYIILFNKNKIKLYNYNKNYKIHKIIVQIK